MDYKCSKCIGRATDVLQAHACLLTLCLIKAGEFLLLKITFLSTHFIKQLPIGQYFMRPNVKTNVT